MKEYTNIKPWLAHSSKFFSNGLTCPYCKKGAKWCPNEEVYGKRYGKSYMCYWCKDCDAYVGTHNNSKKPLGTMANKELRQMRMKTHTVIDPLYKSGRMRRKTLYRRLQDYLGHEVHVGWADMEECQKIIEAAQVLGNIKSDRDY